MSKSFFELTKNRFRNDNINKVVHNGYTYTAEHIIKGLTEYFKQIYSETITAATNCDMDKILNKLSSQFIQLLPEETEWLARPINIDELLKVTKDTHNKLSAPGIYGYTYQAMSKHIHFLATPIIKTFRQWIKDGKCGTNQNLAYMILIAKKKLFDGNCANLRPIQLTPVLTKTFERIWYNRFCRFVHSFQNLYTRFRTDSYMVEARLIP